MWFIMGLISLLLTEFYFTLDINKINEILKIELKYVSNFPPPFLFSISKLVNSII